MKFIRDIRKKLKLTQAGLAALYNVTPPRKLRTSREAIAKYETNRCSMPAEKYNKFLSLLGRKS